MIPFLFQSIYSSIDSRMNMDERSSQLNSAQLHKESWLYDEEM